MSEWHATTLDQLVKLQRGHDLPTGQRRPGKIPVVGAAGPSGLHDTAIVKAPGVVVGRAGASMGHATYCDVDFWPLNTSLYVTDFMGNEPRFVYYLLHLIDFSGYNSGAAQPMLNRNYIKQIPILLPKPGEQRAIIAVLGALDDKIVVNKRIAAMARSLSRAKAVDALSGLSGDVALLGDHVEVTKGLSYRSADLVPGNGNLVTLKCIDPTGRFKQSGLKPFSGVAKPAQIVQHGDVLVAQTDLTQRADVLGRSVRVVQIGEQARLVASLDLAVVRSAGFLTPEYIDALFASREFREHALSYANGTTVLHLGARAIPEFTFAVPDEKVVTAVTGVTRSLFETAVQAEREAATLAILRDTLLPQLMSGRLRVKDAEKIVEDAT
ncbi:restriction endonuclease subunit S [Streptomyces sp. NPDC017230]|uniref:restriction endonuclease subunit S n=1 Tax=unclassified Streptomyces TaxID=2593676 RepID=UPI0037B91162